MKTISIQGPWSVGKSSLISGLSSIMELDSYTMKEFGDEERIIRDKLDLDLTLKEDFLKNQEIFFEGESLRYEKIRRLNHDYLILDRGPEDTLCFSEIHPKAIGADWRADAEILELSQRLIRFRSDAIIYLDATQETLEQRRSSDETKKRRNYKLYMGLYYHLEKEYFMNLRNCTRIDTTNLDASQVLSFCLKIIRGLP